MVKFLDRLPGPWQVLKLTPEEFLLGMATIGPYQDINLVGSFAAPNDKAVRTAHRDIPLPFHRDGIRDDEIAALQDGMYVEKPHVDVVGMYCLRRNVEPCVTVLAADKAATQVLARVDLHPFEALIWDNRLWHGREGGVGERILIRFWSTCIPVRERALVLDKEEL